MIVGQNGCIWFKGNNFEDEFLVLQAIEKIDREAHTTGLTDRVKEFLEEMVKDRKPPAQSAKAEKPVEKKLAEEKKA
jgi:exosome complex component RRP4